MLKKVLLLSLATIVAQSPQPEERRRGLAANSVVQMLIIASAAHAPKNRYKILDKRHKTNTFQRVNLVSIILCLRSNYLSHAWHFAHWHFVHHFHHTFHLFKLFKKCIELCYFFTCTFGYTCLAAWVYKVGVAPL